MKEDFIQTIKIEPGYKYILVVNDKKRIIDSKSLEDFLKEIEYFIKSDKQTMILRVYGNIKVKLERQI